MNSKGWVKLHRQIMENHFLMSDDTACLVFLKLLMLVGTNKGEWSGSVRSLAQSEPFEAINYTTLYKSLNRLESNQIIKQVSNHRKTIIHICNWHKYQGTGKQSGKQVSKHPVSTEGAPGKQSAKINRGEKIAKNKNKELRIQNDKNELGQGYKKAKSIAELIKQRKL